MEITKTERLTKLVFDGEFGLEREMLRVDQKGYLSQTPHPFPGNAHIDRDFCESQIEIISPVCSSIDALMQAVESIDREAKEGLSRLDPPEYLWPFSNPPYLPAENEIPVAKYEGDQKEKEIYRNYLSKKYGKKKMLYCGIHFNYSYSDAFIKQAMIDCGETELQKFKNFLYLSLSEKIEQYSWLLVFLTAASPVYDGSFDVDGAWGKDGFCGQASMRNGAEGYWNDFVPIIDYRDMEKYTESIESYVKTGQFYSASEWYTPVRIKPRGENTPENLRKNGANHIELRMLDINPLSRIGVSKTDLQMIHLFLIYLTFKKSMPFDAKSQVDAVAWHKQAALYRADQALIQLGDKTLPLPQAALRVLEEMEAFYEILNRRDVLPVIEEMKQRCVIPETRYAYRVYQKFHKQYVQQGMGLAEYYADANAKDLLELDGSLSTDRKE